MASSSRDVSDSGAVSIKRGSSGFIFVNTGDVSRGINGISGDQTLETGRRRLDSANCLLESPTKKEELPALVQEIPTEAKAVRSIYH